MTHRRSPTFRRRSVAAVTSLSFTLCSLAATPADVMFSHTQAQASNSQSANNYYGGSYSVRVPQRTYQIFSGDAPRFTAGCGGIDLHLGSFSFISIDAFKDMLRKIAQAAPGYFLHLAIQTMCNPCQTLLSWLQNLMAELNNMQMNSCQIGKKIGASLFTSMFDGEIADDSVFKKGYDRAMTEARAASGSDWVQTLGLSGLAKALENKTIEEQKRINALDGRGNVLVHQFVTQGIPNKFDFSMLGGDRAGFELRSSMFGTTIRRPLDPATAATAVPNGEPTPSNDEIYAGNLGIGDLVMGPDDSNASYHECGGILNFTAFDACQQVSNRKWKEAAPQNSSAFRGTREWAHEILFGNTDIVNPQIGSTGMLSAIRNGTTLRPRELQLLQVAPPGAFQLLLEVKHHDQALKNMALVVRDVVQEGAAIEITRALLSSLDESKTTAKTRVVGSSLDAMQELTGEIPPHVLEREKTVRAELNARDAAYRTRGAMIVEDLAKRASYLRSLTPTFAASSRR